jgi:hypothetical protein
MSAIRQKVAGRTMLVCLQIETDGLFKLRRCTPVLRGNDVPTLAKESHTDSRDVVQKHLFHTSECDLIHLNSRQKFIQQSCLAQRVS